MKSKLVFIGIILLIIGRFFLQIYVNRNDLLTKFNYTYWQFRYSHSQWVPAPTKCVNLNAHINPYTCHWDDNWYAKHPVMDTSLLRQPIGDDGLYMYAGAAYLKGADPTLLNAEIPPFGKYMLGFVETYFHYNAIFNVFFACLALFLYFVFNKLLFKSNLWSLIPVLLFSFDMLFLEQINGSYMDTMFLSLLFLTFIFFFKRKYLLSGVFLGLFMATKAPFLLGLIGATYVVYYLLQKKLKAHLKSLVLLFAVACGVFIATYTRTFLLGHNISYFIAVQKYIIHFYMKGAKGIFGAVVPMLLWGQWYTWFSASQKVAEWSLLWSISVVGTLSAVFYWWKNKQHVILFELLWIGTYFMFLCLTPIFSRYLLLLLPFMYNLTIWSLYELIKKKSS